MRFFVLGLALTFVVAGQTSRPSGNEGKTAWFTDRGIEAYPSLLNAREMPIPPGKDRPGHMLIAQTRDPQEQVVAFYKAKYPEAKTQQLGTSAVIEGKTPGGSKFVIRLMPAGSVTAVQYTTEK